MTLSNAGRVLAFVLVLTNLLCTFSLSGPNVCYEQRNYTMTTMVKYQQPVSVRTYSWCFDFPPKCSSVHTEMREKWKVQTLVRTKTVEVCCEGFEEEENFCSPKCKPGFMGDMCDEGCPLERWGPSCANECSCPINSVCDSRNGKCVCLEGWHGHSCNLTHFTKSIIPPFRINTNISKATKLFDWNSPVMSTTDSPSPTDKNVKGNDIDITTFRPIMESTTKLYTKSHSDNDLKSTKYMISPKTNNLKEDNNDAWHFFINNTTTEIINQTENNESKDKMKPESYNQSSTQSIKFEITTEVPIKKTTHIVTQTQTVLENNKTHIKPTGKTGNVVVTTISQIESPNISKVSTTTLATIDVILKNVSNEIVTQTITKSESTTEAPSTTISTVSTTKRKTYKIFKPQSEILNITLHSFGSNDTNSKIFKTVTISPIRNTTLKIPHSHTKGKNVHESKMITIPVRVIMDSGKIPSNIYAKKNTSQRKSGPMNDQVQKMKVFNGYPIQMINITLSPMITTDIHTEETKHVLTEPEQITSIAGSDDDFDSKDELFSVISIGIGVTMLLIILATIIILVARHRQIRIEKNKNVEMGHVQSMMSISEDEVQSSYLRSAFHSPLPDPPSQIIAINKSKFHVPFVQSVMVHQVSPLMMESFRDILECHYDHPKPPRPAIYSPVSNFREENPPSVYQHLNTFSTVSHDANQKNREEDGTSFPVTNAAIDVLKSEHQSALSAPIEGEEPVYDEIPNWFPGPKRIHNNNLRFHEAVTEL